MKKSWTLIALAAALAASAASAQTTTPSTTAGTEIKNVAEITYTPEGGTGTTTVPSNPVTVIVTAVPSFTITPNDGSGDKTKPDYSHPGQTAGVKPCDKNVVFTYVLTNTGNVDNETYTLTNTPDPTGKVKTPDNIRFYADSADTSRDGVLSPSEIAAATPVTSIGPVKQGEAVKFFQVYDIPCTASGTDVFGGDPTGERNNQTNPNLNPATPLPKDANNSNTTTVSRNDGVVIGPRQDPDGNGNPTTPPYQSIEGVTITPSASDTQVAQATTTTTTITFTNTVQNTGNRDDVLNIVVDPATDITGFPAGTTVVLIDPKTGQPLTDSNNDGKPDVGVVTPGSTADVWVKVTFPAGSQPTPGTIPTVTVHVVSSNDPTKSDPTKDIVNVPGLSFGDPTPTVGGDSTIVGTPPAGTPGNPSTPVDVSTCTGSGTLTYLPMEIANLGSAPDLYNVTGTAPITLTNGTVQIVNVVYYKDTNNNGVYDAGIDTALTDTNGDGKADTGLIAGGQEMKLIAVVTVPCAAAGQTITLNQNATSPNTNTTADDKNDTITVGTKGTPTITKTADKTTAVPQETITYTIIGKNASNSNVYGVMVCDSVPENTTFDSATFNFSGLFGGPSSKLVYKVDDSAWASTVNTSLIKPGTATAKGSKICVGVDTNGDGSITTADVMKPGDTITVIFKAKVN